MIIILSMLDNEEEKDEEEADSICCTNCGKTISKPFIFSGKVFCSEHCFDEWNKKQIEEKPLDKTVEEEAVKTEEKGLVDETEIKKQEILRGVEEETRRYYEGGPKVEYKEEEKKEEKEARPFEDTDIALHKIKEERDPDEILKREHHVYKKDDMLDRMKEKEEEQVKKTADDQYQKEKKELEKGEKPSHNNHK